MKKIALVFRVFLNQHGQKRLNIYKFLHLYMIFLAKTCQTKKNRTLCHACVSRYFAAEVQTFLKKRVILLTPTVCTWTLTWTCSIFTDMHHVHGHAVWTWTCSIDMDTQHGFCHSAWIWTLDMHGCQSANKKLSPAH